MSDIETVIRDMVRAEVARQLEYERRRYATAELLDTAEAAEFARVAPGTIRRWVREGRLTEHRAGIRVRVKREELERLLATRRRDESQMSPEALAELDFG